MSIARKIVLLSVMVMAAMALAASSASAQAEESVEVRKEPNPGSHCTAASTCQIHASGTSSLVAHIFGFESTVSSCTDEFTANVNEQGNGTITGIALTGANCTRIQCNGVGEAAAESSWPITLAGETDTNPNPDAGHMWVRFCLDTSGDPNATGSHCNVEIQIVERATNHDYQFSVNDWSCPTVPRSEVTGTWNTETGGAGEEDVEIVHTTPNT